MFYYEAHNTKPIRLLRSPVKQVSHSLGITVDTYVEKSTAETFFEASSQKRE